MMVVGVCGWAKILATMVNRQRQCSSGHHQGFFLFQILWQKILKPIKTNEKVTYFTIQFRSKNLFWNCFEIENNMFLKHRQEAFSDYKFSRNHVTVWCQKKHLHCPIFWHPRTTFLKHFESKCLYICSVYLPKEIFVPNT